MGSILNVKYQKSYFIVAIIATFLMGTHADDDAGDCMSLDCDASVYKPVCGGLDADSSEGFQNECALQIYNCQHNTGSIFIFFNMTVVKHFRFLLI